jgi:hypothetical protein
MANHMAHQGDGVHSSQGSEASAATIGNPRPHSGTALSGPRDDKEGQRANRKANDASNHKANWKANHEADCGRRAKTPKYAHDDWDQSKLCSNDELDKAKKAQDNINNYADEDGASGDDEDNIKIKTIATGDLAAMKILAKNRYVRGTTAARLAQIAQKVEAAPGWTGSGVNYKAWVEALYQVPGSPEAASTQGHPNGPT